MHKQLHSSKRIQFSHTTDDNHQDFPFRSASASLHSSSERYIIGQFEKASSHRQSAIWAVPSVDSEGTCKLHFWEGHCRGWRRWQCVWSVLPKKNSHSNGSGLHCRGGKRFPPPSLRLSEILERLSRCRQAHNILTAKILNPEKWLEVITVRVLFVRNPVRERQSETSNYIFS